MAMNKKEQAEMAELREQLRLAKALRFTEPVDRDVPIPSGFGALAKGWLYNDHIGSSSPRVARACSSSVSHAFGQDDKTTTQRPVAMYSTELRALRALRHAVELKVAKILADIDERIEEAK